MSLRQRIADYLRERRIAACVAQMKRARRDSDRKTEREAWAAMCMEIQQRSLEQIALMEAARGLRP